ncbi:type II CAAX endopeptidase family protein [Halorubrum sp. AD140]|uniref:CPBP family intramembrane glutamic endopeptidase n=1 Tax=Halorubrum sp. AD140 TaxID=3050073 RepID=UPI002ACD1B27|nr:type II CAAX endopeptidase family protein [Halorubrum sp. AD140]MDZ5811648.1 type II CAAX endopeptidase family protein [Halorubrum sp. AD140]
MLWSIKRVAARAPVLAFLVLTFGYSWTNMAIVALTVEETGLIHEFANVHGPVIGAAVMVWLLDEDVRSWIGHVRNWRVGLKWYLIALTVPILCTDLDNVAALALGAEVGRAETPLVLYLLNFLVVLVFAGALEEFGWRGFLQTRLQQRYSALATTVFIGFVWAVWHIPLYFVIDHAYDPANLGPYVLYAMAASVIFGWLYNSTDGGLLVVMIAHAAGNMPPYLTVTGDRPAIVETVPISEFAYVLGAILVVWYAGAQTLSRDRSMAPIPSQSENT